MPPAVLVLFAPNVFQTEALKGSVAMAKVERLALRCCDLHNVFRHATLSSQRADAEDQDDAAARPQVFPKAFVQHTLP